MTSTDFVDELNSQETYWKKGFDYPIVQFDTTTSLKNNYDKSVVYVIPDSLMADSTVIDTTSKDTTIADTTSKDTTIADTTSKEKIPTKDTTSIIAIKALQPEIQVFARGSNVTILNAVGPVVVFDMQGNIVTRVQATPGVTQLRMSTTGSYIVRTGRTTKQIFIK